MPRCPHVRGHSRRSQLKKKYGITPEEKEARILKQSNCCAICGTDKPGGRYLTLVTDHNHATGQLRGELRDKCNRGLGYFNESPQLLLNAITYLGFWWSR